MMICNQNFMGLPHVKFLTKAYLYLIWCLWAILDWEFWSEGAMEENLLQSSSPAKDTSLMCGENHDYKVNNGWK